MNSKLTSFLLRSGIGRWKGAGLAAAWLFWLGASVVGGAEATAERPEVPRVTTTNHWAFQPLRQHAVPERGGSERGRKESAIDGFIRAELAGVGLKPGREAGRAVLIRRVALTVTGLPPTPEEIQTYEQDRKPGAYERMVDHFLNSPGYGERWGKYWLDAAGYADSNGYFSADTDRPYAHRYRDYVIRSMNADKPFDRFVREQVAGDELSGWKPGEPVTPGVIELLEATHFLRNGQDGTGESDGNPDEVRVDRYYALESSMQIIGSCLMGVTVQCAKCHDHKFEPVSQRNYFELQAHLYPAFNVEKWLKPNDRVVDAPMPGELEVWQAKERELDHRRDALRKDFSQWHSEARPKGSLLFEATFDAAQTWADAWSNVAPGDDGPGGSPAVTFDSGVVPSASVKDGALRIAEGGGSGDRWISTRESFSWRPARTGEWIQVTFDLKAVNLEPGGKTADRVGYLVALHDFNDNSSTAGGNILVDGNPGGATAVHVDYPGSDAKSRGEIGGMGYEPGRNYGVRLTRKSGDEVVLEHVVDGVVEGKRVILQADEVPTGGFGFEYCCGRSFVVDNVRIESSRLEDADWVKRDAAFQTILAERRKTLEAGLAEVAAARTSRPGRIAWVTDGGAELPKVPLLKRGNPKTPGDAVEPAFPGFLGGNPMEAARAASASGNGRTTGLRMRWVSWLTEPGTRASALLARVAVNRIWQGYFGVGIVPTPDNLGVSGARPTHPELLEWLAWEFVRSGWSQKAVHRLILNSAVFRQSSVATAEAIKRDEPNARLSRFPMRRLDAESVRDSILAVSGKLGSKMGGTYVPTTRNAVGEVVVDESRPDAFSRSVYLQQRRTQVTTLLGLFDAPSLVFNCTRRPATTMPLQSLSLLNSEFSVARGGDLAARLRRECGEDVDARVRRAFLLVTSRPPDRSERRAAAEFLAEQTRAYAGKPDAMDRAWADFCQSLFALNAFLYLE